MPRIKVSIATLELLIAAQEQALLVAKGDRIRYEAQRASDARHIGSLEEDLIRVDRDARMLKAEINELRNRSHLMPIAFFPKDLILGEYIIPGIKRVRELTGLGLKEAKDYVDTHYVKEGGKLASIVIDDETTATFFIKDGEVEETNPFLQ